MAGQPITTDEMVATLRNIINAKVWTSAERARRTEVLTAMIGLIQITKQKLKDEGKI